MVRGSVLLSITCFGLLFALCKLVSAGSPTAQKDLFQRRCSGCHALDENKEGPRLRGVFGRQSGTASAFVYSDALKKARITWDAASLDKWLADPDKLVPDTDMAFRMEKPEERTEIIAYLKQISGQ